MACRPGLAGGRKARIFLPSESKCFECVYAGPLVYISIYRFFDGLICRFVNCYIHGCTYSAIHCFVDRSMHRFIDSLFLRWVRFDSSIDRCADLPISRTWHGILQNVFHRFCCHSQSLATIKNHNQPLTFPNFPTQNSVTQGRWCSRR